MNMKVPYVGWGMSWWRDNTIIFFGGGELDGDHKKLEALWNEKKNLDHQDKRVTPSCCSPLFIPPGRKWSFESCNHDTVGKGTKP